MMSCGQASRTVVTASHVAVVRGVRRERLAAVLALEGLLSGVLADVRAQDARRRERLAAVHALVRPLPAVHLQHPTMT